MNWAREKQINRKVFTACKVANAQLNTYAHVQVLKGNSNKNSCQGRDWVALRVEERNETKVKAQTVSLIHLKAVKLESFDWSADRQAMTASAAAAGDSLSAVKTAEEREESDRERGRHRLNHQRPNRRYAVMLGLVSDWQFDYATHVNNYSMLQQVTRLDTRLSIDLLTISMRNPVNGAPAKSDSMIGARLVRACVRARSNLYLRLFSVFC